MASEKETTMELDFTRSAVLEGMWQGLSIFDIAQMLGHDPLIVASIMDELNETGLNQ